MSATQEIHATQGKAAKATEGKEPWSWKYCLAVWTGRLACFCIFLYWVGVYFGDLESVMEDLKKDHETDLELLPICLKVKEERRTVKFDQHDCKSVTTILWYHIPELPVLGWDVTFFTYRRRVVWNVSGNTWKSITNNLLYIGAGFMCIFGLNATVGMFKSMFGWLPGFSDLLPNFFPKK